jgi:hypothetical protein
MFDWLGFADVGSRSSMLGEALFFSGLARSKLSIAPTQFQPY